jgi:hypothetical protein
VLDDPAIDEAACMKHHTGAKQLNRLGDFGGLGETVQSRQHCHGIKKPVSAGYTANQEPPRQPFHPRHV